MIAIRKSALQKLLQLSSKDNKKNSKIISSLKSKNQEIEKKLIEFNKRDTNIIILEKENIRLKQEKSILANAYAKEIGVLK